MINTSSERLKARNFFICRYFSFNEQLKFRTEKKNEKKCYNLGAWSRGHTGKLVHPLSGPLR